MTKEAIGFIVQRVACDINYPETTEQEERRNKATKMLWQKLVEAEVGQSK